MPTMNPDWDREGSWSYRLTYNRDAGVWEKYDGHEGHSRMETVFKSAVSLGTSLFTLSSTQRAYITFLQMEPLTRGKTLASLHLVASGATAATMMHLLLRQQTGGLSTNRFGDSRYIRGDGVTPFLEVALGKTFVFKSRPNAITSKITCTFYRVTATGDK